MDPSTSLDMLSFPRMLVTTAGVIALVISYTIFQRLYLHPLARYPGPLLARISAWPNWYHAAKGDRHLWLLQLHSHYGSVVRFTPKSVAFDTVSAVETIYKSRNANVRKADWYQYVRDSAGGYESTFTAREKARHDIKRRLLSHAFSERAHRDYEPRIARLARTWLDCLGRASQGGDGVVDMKDWTNYLVFDILGDLCFGKSFDLMNSETNRFVTSLVPQTTGGWYTLGYHPWTHFLRWLLYRTRLGPFLSIRSHKDNGRFRDFCLAALVERKRSGSADSKDMFHHLFTGTDPETGQGYGVGDLACESVLLMVAGSHTTSTALAATIFYLTGNPDKLCILTKEVRAAFGGEDEIRYSAGGRLAELPYLRACIDEGLRLTPPNPSHLPREVLRGGMAIDGHWFPPGVDVGVAAYAVQRNGDYCPEPGRFIPERWIDGGARREAPVLTAFSAGPTGCIGKQLAYMEMHLVLALLVYRFEIEPRDAGSMPSEYQMRDTFVGDGVGPFIRLHAKS